MSDFSQIMVEAILVLIFGVWTAIMSKLWEDGSKKIKAVIITVTVLAFLAVIGFAGYNQWIPLRMEDILTLLRRIIKGLIMLIITLILSVMMGNILVELWGALLEVLFDHLSFKNDTICNVFICISGLISAIIFLLIEYLILVYGRYDYAEMLFVAIPLAFGYMAFFITHELLPANMPDTSQTVIMLIGAILSACLYILMAYETFAFFTTHQFAPPLGAVKWIADAFVALFT